LTLTVTARDSVSLLEFRWNSRRLVLSRSRTSAGDMLNSIVTEKPVWRFGTAKQWYISLQVS